MPGISIHVVDVSRGVVASGMTVELYAVGADRQCRLVASGAISSAGVLAHEALNRKFEPGFYEARLHVGDFYRTALGSTAKVPFLDVVCYRFGLADAEAHYHLPVKCTPWGYSCFRGGA
ncbi:MAG: hydroxyisourate hydrolase [Rhodospirillales bacterium]